MDSIPGYHDEEKVVSEIKDYLIYQFEEIVRLRTSDDTQPSNKKRGSNRAQPRTVSDEMVKLRIRNLRYQKLQVIPQVNGYDCVIHAHANIHEMIPHFMQWLESSGDERNYHFTEYWNITFSRSPEQVQALRIFYYAQCLKISESFFFYGEYNNLQKDFVKSPGILELRKINKTLVGHLETKYQQLLETTEIMVAE